MAAKKRILHVVGYASRGGCETCCAAFIRHTPGFEHSVLVLGEPGPMSAVWSDMGANVTHLDALRAGWWRFYTQVSAELRAKTFAGVVVWAGIRFPLLQAVLARHDCPVVLHAGNPFAAGSRVRLMLRASSLFLPRLRNLTVIACSEHVAVSYAHAPYYRRFRVEACLNPIEAPAANPHRCRPLDPGAPVRIGMVARLDQIKDHAALIRAFGLIRTRWPRAELHLAGDGPLRPDLESLVRELGLDAAVCFHGSVQDVPAFLNQLDVFCFITTPREGMGNALAEAMAQGLPCIVNDLPVMHEVAGWHAERAARFATTEPAQIGRAIEELLRDETGRSKLSEAAWHRASEVFSPRRVVDRYLAALEVVP